MPPTPTQPSDNGFHVIRNDDLEMVEIGGLTFVYIDGEFQRTLITNRTRSMWDTFAPTEADFDRIRRADPSRKNVSKWMHR